MNDVDHSIRWRGTVLAGSAGTPAILQDDWCLSTEEGEVLARVFRSRTESNKYFGAVCLGRSSVAGDIVLDALPSRRMAMEACEDRLTTIANILTR